MPKLLPLGHVLDPGGMAFPMLENYLYIPSVQAESSTELVVPLEAISAHKNDVHGGRLK